MPTAKRALSATLVRRGGDRLLFDCAEGTQRQLLWSDIGLVELEEIFLTHLHADHYLGLPGMLKTYSLRGRELPLRVYGPGGLRERLSKVPHRRASLVRGRAHRARGRRILERAGYRIETFPVEHGVSAIGRAIVESERPGRFDVEAPAALGVPDGPERDASNVVGERGPGRRAGGGVRTGSRACPPGEEARPERRHAAGGVGRRGIGRRRCARPRGDVPPGRARTARETLHSTAGEAALVAREAGGGCSRSHTCRLGTSAIRWSRRRASSSPRRSCRVTSTWSTYRSPSEAPELVRAGARSSRAVRVRGDVTRLVQVRSRGTWPRERSSRSSLRPQEIESQLEAAVEHDADALDDLPLKVLVAESDIDEARDAIDALAEIEDEEE